jgi:indole-3-glycerol phosphate synthase
MSAAAGREKHRDSVLGRILAHKKEEISLRKRQLPLRELQRQSADLPPARDFRQAISRWIGVTIEVFV